MKKLSGFNHWILVETLSRKGCCPPIQYSVLRLSVRSQSNRWIKVGLNKWWKAALFYEAPGFWSNHSGLDVIGMLPTLIARFCEMEGPKSWAQHASYNKEDPCTKRSLLCKWHDYCVMKLSTISFRIIPRVDHLKATSMLLVFLAASNPNHQKPSCL